MNYLPNTYEKEHKGFTFIEILVVVTIMAVLIVAGIVSFASVNKRSRDARRKSDVEQIRSALEMYRADEGHYPLTANPTQFVTITSDSTFTTALSSYMATIPEDPKNNDDYPYKIRLLDQRISEYYGYCLTAFTEGAGSGSNSCGLTLPTSSTTGESYTYGVKNP